MVNLLSDNGVVNTPEIKVVGALPDSWAFGWKTGIDNDLICIKPNIDTSQAGEFYLSPVCHNRFLALLAFALKVILLKIDCNLRGLEG